METPQFPPHSPHKYSPTIVGRFRSAARPHVPSSHTLCACAAGKVILKIDLSLVQRSIQFKGQSNTVKLICLFRAFTFNSS